MSVQVPTASWVSEVCLATPVVRGIQVRPAELDRSAGRDRKDAPDPRDSREARASRGPSAPSVSKAPLVSVGCKDSRGPRDPRVWLNEDSLANRDLRASKVLLA